MKKFIVAVVFLSLCSYGFAKSSSSSSSSSRSYSSSPSRSSSYSSPSRSSSYSSPSRSNSSSSYSSKPKSARNSSTSKSSKVSKNQPVKTKTIIRYRSIPARTTYITRTYYTPYRISSDMGVGLYHPYTNWLLWYYIVSHTNCNNYTPEYERQTMYETTYRNYVLREFRKTHPDMSIRIYRFRVGTEYTTFIYDNQEYRVINRDNRLIFSIFPIR